MTGKTESILKRILISVFIAVCVLGVFGKASAGDKDLKMHGVNVLKLQIADLEAALLEEKYKRAQDRKTLIKVLDLWEHGITYTDANAYTFNQKTSRYVKKKEEKKKLEPKETKQNNHAETPRTQNNEKEKKPETKDVDGAKIQESKKVKEVINDNNHTVRREK